jgi:hypothetical protein
VGSCEHINETLGSMKDGLVPQQMSDCQLQRMSLLFGVILLINVWCSVKSLSHISYVRLKPFKKRIFHIGGTRLKCFNLFHSIQ